MRGRSSVEFSLFLVRRTLRRNQLSELSFFAMVALYDHIFKVSLAPSLYAIFKVLSMLFYLTALEKATANPNIRISSSSWF
jgi:hypothetical protein